MSYEGYDLLFCENGHMSQYDCYSSPFCYYYDAENTVTCHCGAAYVEFVSVDETNGLPYMLSFEVEEIDPGRRAEVKHWGFTLFGFHFGVTKEIAHVFPRYKLTHLKDFWYNYYGGAYKREVQKEEKKKAGFNDVYQKGSDFGKWKEN